MRWASPEQVKVRKDFTFPSTTTRRLERQGGGSYWTVGFHVGRWIETNCVLTAARFMGQPFKLLPWQWRFLAELFEVVRDGDGWRLKHRWCLLGLPKKNGKSELIGALALFFLLGTDEPDPRIFVAASTEDQANMVFAPVKYMSENSPTISALVTTKDRLVVSRSQRGGFVRRLAAVAGANDGANVYVALCDEFHEWTGRGKDVHDIITNGTVMREEPMIIQITTAGYDEDTVCYTHYSNIMSMMDGSLEDDTYYGCWFSAPYGMSHKHPDYARLSNPSFGSIMTQPFYDDQVTKKTEAVYRRYFGNEWTDAEEIWDAASKWDDLEATEDRPLICDVNARTYVGVDIGRKIDSSAVAGVQAHVDEDGTRRLHVFQKIWSNPYPVGHSLRKEWRMNVHEVDEYLRDIYQTFPVASGRDPDDEDIRTHGPVFGYDPHLYGTHADDLAEDGLNMVEVPQTDTQMVPASQSLYEAIMSEEIVHDGDPEMRRHVRSVIAKQKERGWRISKPVGSDKHVDGAIALAIAVRLALANETTESLSDGPSIY